MLSVFSSYIITKLSRSFLGFNKLPTALNVVMLIPFEFKLPSIKDLDTFLIQTNII
jgi:hypothetical protein